MRFLKNSFKIFSHKKSQKINYPKGASIRYFLVYHLCFVSKIRYCNHSPVGLLVNLIMCERIHFALLFIIHFESSECTHTCWLMIEFYKDVTFDDNIIHFMRSFLLKVHRMKEKKTNLINVEYEGIEEWREKKKKNVHRWQQIEWEEKEEFCLWHLEQTER